MRPESKNDSFKINSNLKALKDQSKSIQKSTHFTNS